MLFPLDFHLLNRNAKLLGLVRGIPSRCGHFSPAEYVTVILPVLLQILANKIITVVRVGSFIITHLHCFVLIFRISSKLSAHWENMKLKNNSYLETWV